MDCPSRDSRKNTVLLTHFGLWLPELQIISYCCFKPLNWNWNFQLFVTPWTSGLPGSSLHGILQARVLEWVAISFSRGSSQPRDRTQVFCIPGRRFNLWATGEAPKFVVICYSSNRAQIQSPIALQNKLISIIQMRTLTFKRLQEA